MNANKLKHIATSLGYTLLNLLLIFVILFYTIFIVEDIPVNLKPNEIITALIMCIIYLIIQWLYLFKSKKYFIFINFAPIMYLTYLWGVVLIDAVQYHRTLMVLLLRTITFLTIAIAFALYVKCFIKLFKTSTSEC